jgi:TPR repeat protein
MTPDEIRKQIFASVESPEARELRRRAELGDPIAQWQLGNAFSKGLEGFYQDRDEAVKWIRLSADQEYANAQNSLGVYFENGWGGLEKNPKEAVRLFGFAADQNSAKGTMNLGRAYMDGWGDLPKNREKAKALLLKAVELGEESARVSLDKLSAEEATKENNPDLQRATELELPETAPEEKPASLAFYVCMIIIAILILLFIVIMFDSHNPPTP